MTFLVTFSLKFLKIFLFFIRAEACKKQTGSTALDMTVVTPDTSTALFFLTSTLSLSIYL